MQFFCILDQLHERERESFTTLAQQRVRVTAGEGLHISQLGFAVLLSMAERMKKKRTGCRAWRSSRTVEEEDW